MYRPSDGFEVIITPLYSSRRVFVKSLLWPVAVCLSPAHQGERRERERSPPAAAVATMYRHNSIKKKHKKKLAPTEHAGLIEI